MKKIFSLTLIAILALTAVKADATVVKESELKSIIAQKVVENFRQYTDAQMEVNVVALPFRELNLPEGQITYEIKTNATKFMARDLEKVTVYVNGRVAKVFNAPVVIKAYKNVLVASGEIPRERELSASVVKIEKREVSNIIDNVLEAEDLSKGIIAKKFFAKNELVDRRYVKLRPDIMRNSLVTVMFNTNNLTISIEATALSDGSVGDNICIMNKGYNKIYKGIVIGENKVLVKI